MEILIPVATIAVLILLNGLFVAAEFAIVGVPRATIERRAAEGHRVARQVRRILHEPRRQDRYIATAQLGITFASLGLGMYGEHVLAEWIAHALGATGLAEWIAVHGVASVLSVAILTYFHIVIGEMVPKSLALLHADDTALWVTPPMRWIQFALYPLVIGLNGIGNGVLRLMGVRREFGVGQYHTPEEIRYLVAESEEGGLMSAESGRVLRELFEFGAITAGEAMVPRVAVVGLPLDAGPEEVLAHVRRSRHTRYPVYDGDLDHVVGAIHAKDLLDILRSGQPLRAGEIRPVPYVPESAELDDVLATLRKARAQMAIVMDEHGGTSGIITLEDLFEEVIGDIDDGATGRSSIVVNPDGSADVRGTVRLDELGEALGIVLEHDEVHTVSGLVLDLLGRPATVGDVVSYGRLRCAVTAVAGRGVRECHVTAEPLPGTDVEPS
jgi:CBS domain containing-hemolysin-like protein